MLDRFGPAAAAVPSAARRARRAGSRRRWTGTGCGPRPRRPRRWRKATGCAPPCSLRSATTCAPRWRPSRPASAPCGRPTCEWTEADEAALLATIEASADRLDALIGNLLDMSRLTTGSLQPFLRPTAIDEVAPVALRGLDGGNVLRARGPGRAAAGADRPRPARAGAGQLVRQRPGLLADRPAGRHARRLTAQTAYC